MRKIILLFCLYASCLLFHNSVLAEMSDKEKREFIESLAELSKEKRVFYRWHTKRNNKKLLKAEEMTPEIHHSLTEGLDSGLRVSKDISTLSAYGNTLIRIEMGPGRFLDLLDREVQIQLKRKGISVEDVYRLDPQLAIPDLSALQVQELVAQMVPQPLQLAIPPLSSNHFWWNLRAKEGIKFKPFSSEGLSLKELEEAYESLEETAPRHYSDFFSFLDKPFSLSKKRQYFINLIREDILKRSEESAAVAVFRGPFIKIVEEEKGWEYVASKVHHYSHHITSLKEAARWLKYAGEYLFESDKRRIVEKIKQLPIRVTDYNNDFVTATDEFHSEMEQFEDYLSDSEKEELYRKFHSRRKTFINAETNEGDCISSFAD